MIKNERSLGVPINLRERTVGCCVSDHILEKNKLCLDARPGGSVILPSGAPITRARACIASAPLPHVDEDITPTLIVAAVRFFFE